MISTLLLFVPAAVIATAAAWWIARAYAGVGAGAKARPVLIAGGVGLLVTLCLYLAIGRPSLADAPFAERLASAETRARTAPMSLTTGELLAVLDARAKAAPEDARPHLFAADILAGEGRDAEAARAYQAALKREPQLVPALMGLARVSVRMDGGVVSPASLELFRRAAAIDPTDATPWLYQAMAASQEGRPEAPDLWREVYKRLPPDDPRRAMADAMAKRPQPPR